MAIRRYLLILLFGADGGAPISDVQFQLNGGVWESGMTTTSPLVITGQPNQSEFTEIRIRSVNSVGVSNSSNMVEGRATKRLRLERYFALDTDLFSNVQNLTFGMRDATDETVIHSANIDTNTPNETWERIPGQHYGFNAGTGGIMVDHEGHLRCYYEMRFPDNGWPNGGDLKHAVAVQRSMDGGNTWNYIRDNLYSELISDPDSNLIDIPAPPGGSVGGIETPTIWYDPNPSIPTNERYKALFKWNGSDSTYIAISSDGLTFSNTAEVFTEVQGDDIPGSLFFDTNKNEWKIVGRGRGRGGSSAPGSGPPKNYEDTRWIYVATASSYDGPYSVQTFVIDPAIIYNYNDEADFTSFWSSFTDACGNGWEPANPQDARIRPDLYLGTVKFYHGQYISLFPTFFRDDNRVPQDPNQLDRTTGPIYPIWGHSRIVDEYGLTYNGVQGATGVEGGWKFPDDDFPAVDLTPYSRSDGDSCSTSDGVSEVGQVYSGFSFDVMNEKMFLAVGTANLNHYDIVNTNLADTREIGIHQLTEDRFARLIAGGTEGSWRTSRLNIPSGTTKLIVNADVSGTGSLKIEILNSITGDPIDGFTKSDSNSLTGDSIDHEATWASNEMSELEGQNCRLKFYIENGEIYSYRFE